MRTRNTAGTKRSAMTKEKEAGSQEELDVGWNPLPSESESDKDELRTPNLEPAMMGNCVPVTDSSEDSGGATPTTAAVLETDATTDGDDLSSDCSERREGETQGDMRKQTKLREEYALDQVALGRAENVVFMKSRVRQQARQRLFCRVKFTVDTDWEYRAHSPGTAPPLCRRILDKLVDVRAGESPKERTEREVHFWALYKKVARQAVTRRMAEVQHNIRDELLSK